MQTAGVGFTLDGRSIVAAPGETILAAASRHGIAIPHLCHQRGLRPDGNCRACMVEIAGERSLAASCCRTPTPGMTVRTDSERARVSQRLVLELLLADLPEAGHKWCDDAGLQPHGELSAWAARLGVVVRPALAALRREAPAPDLTHPAMAVNLAACIHCTRCVRACREVQVNDVIGYARRGEHSKIVFDLDDSMGASSCVGCGECVASCPTGALMPKSMLGSQVVDRSVDSVCPYCGVGCLITYRIRGERIVGVDGRDGPANRSRLCVKGRFGQDYVHHPQRLTRPLLRRPGVAKDPAAPARPGDWREVFREATWDEALAAAAGGLASLRDGHGPKSLAGFGSAKGSNEEAYLFQKLVRTGFGSNNVDHCTRLCHASSVAALLEGVGSGAVSNPVNDVEHAELILVIGANPAANHPVAATFVKNAAQRGAKIVVADPRVTDLARHAWRVLQFRPDTDVALLNALIHTVIDEGLADAAFIRERVDNFAALRENVKGYSPEAMAPICGIPAPTLREVARAFAKARSALDPPGEARADLWIVQQMARRLGLDWHYPGDEHGVAAVYEEMREAMHEAIAGIPWQRLTREGSVTYPCPSEDEPGQAIVFIDRFPTANGRAKLTPADIIPAAERPDADYPLVLLTGRQLEHWHTGGMTRRAAVLDAIEPMAAAMMNPQDLAVLGIAPGEVVTVQSRRGEVALQVRADEGTPIGAIFIPFAYHEAAANLLTNSALDPTAKIPELKYCAVRVQPGKSGLPP